MHFSRRSLLASGAAGLAIPRFALAAAPTARRLIFIIQRGAADGLTALAPLGDPAYAGLRGDLAKGLETGTRIDATFTLHPALVTIAKLYRDGEAIFAPAVASPYRDRSHFDAQNVLETGALQPYARGDGWLNRLLGLLPGAGGGGLALSPTVPASLRGPIAVASYAPSRLDGPAPDLLERVEMLYAADAQLHGLWQQAMQTRAAAAGLDTQTARGAAATGKLAASLMTAPGAARVVQIETTGWDTHAGQNGRSAALLAGLDGLVGALRDGLGAAWRDTLVVVATEFGRTAAANGTGGTDHGTGSLAMLLGGAVKGGRMIGDWPGLAPRQLYQGRDLQPTLALDALLAGAMSEHFGLDPARAATRLFPGMAQTPLSGLVRG